MKFSSWRALLFFHFIWLLPITSNSQNALKYDGIAMQSTRVIYPESAQKGVAFKVTNYSNMAYLLQSQVTEPNASGQKKPDFIVLPPLEKVNEKDSVVLMIKAINHKMPKDRESLFTLNIRAIPNQKKEEGNAARSQIIIATQNHLKLFYRPDGLPKYSDDEISKKLVFYRDKGRLVVKNPTPYYVTFDSIKVGNNIIDPSSLFEMVPPMGQQQYPLPENTTGELIWTLIDRDGGVTQQYTSELSLFSSLY
ncbi:molecular chaperone [Providencia stuartii]|uniref:fimbrial biogenesis chaperone n=1 Tax=Providencia TaxID=586 RepID=UPI0013A787B5|nr:MULTISPECIES: molecular chaperone [Providencia]ELR5121877.1 molecular chaperone [Providencia stuartii]ELR5140857.1 molecular chaperone [Providencia stuartii]ELZ5941257.1 molecular chaperone [Providencia stuartii]MCK1145316.1 molecular chaperone [Providencia stuartii]QIC15175.1 molecular chaperone [Providencia vermicola]